MKIILLTLFTFLATHIKAQDTVFTGPVKTSSLVDLRPHNKYGDLLNDDPAYNSKYAWWIPASRVILANGFNWAVSRYIFDYDWARISAKTW